MYRLIQSIAVNKLHIWASAPENLSVEFPTKSEFEQSAQLQTS